MDSEVFKTSKAAAWARAAAGVLLALWTLTGEAKAQDPAVSYEKKSSWAETPLKRATFASWWRHESRAASFHLRCAEHLFPSPGRPGRGRAGRLVRPRPGRGLGPRSNSRGRGPGYACTLGDTEDAERKYGRRDGENHESPEKRAVKARAAPPTACLASFRGSPPSSPRLPCLRDDRTGVSPRRRR